MVSTLRKGEVASLMREAVFEEVLFVLVFLGAVTPWERSLFQPWLWSFKIPILFTDLEEEVSPPLLHEM